MEIKKEMIDKKITFCSLCGRVCKGQIKENFILCQTCGVWIPIGADSFYKIKGGVNMAEKKVVAAKAKAVAKSEKTDVKGPSAKERLAEQAILVDEAMTKLFPDADMIEKKKINHAYWKLYLN